MTLFGITAIITALAALGFGLSVYASETSSNVNRWWLALSASVAFWASGLFGVTTAQTENVAALWQYPLDIFGILIPLCYACFIVAFIGADMKRCRPLFVLSAAMIALALTHAFRAGMTQQFGFFWIAPGPLYFLFPVYFALVVFWGMGQLVIAYRHSSETGARAQMRNQLIAAVIGFGGGLTNFFPQLFHVYPFGNYFVILYVFLVSYGVLKYKYLSPKVVAAQIFSGAVVLVFLFNLLQSQSLEAWFVNFMLFLLTGFFSVFLVRSVYLEVAQRETIERQAKELEIANAQQESLLHFISHEIKGYLAKSEAGFAAIAEGDYGAISPQLHEMATSALADVRKGVDTVMSILDASNLKKGTVTFDKKEFDLKAAVLAVVDELKPVAQEKQITIREIFAPTGASHIVGDEQKIKQHVVRNLIDNAIKYTPAGGTIDVSLSQDGGMVRFEAKDSGVGVTQEDMQRLFTEGGHGKDSIKINVHSTGYGLFIAKQVVKAHDGKIWAESGGQGKGSCFIVELPAT